jgi:hypothetical protein
MDIKQLYETHIDKLMLKEKLDLLELLLHETLELIRNGKGLPESKMDSSSQPVEQKAPDINDSGLTEMQKQLLGGPVMAEEDYILYQEKREHFS